MVQKAARMPNWQKFRFCMKPWTENLILHSIFKAEVQLWPFLRMRDSKLGKQPMRRRGPFATTSSTKRTLSCTTLLIKWLSDVQRNGFVGSNRRISTNWPKAASRHIIRPNVRRTVYAKCYNQCCACKTAEMREDTAH